MAGIRDCKFHGRQSNVIVSTNLEKSILISQKEGLIDSKVFKLIVVIEGISASFYSDLETINQLGTIVKGHIYIKETLEEVDEFNVITVACKQCLQDYIALISQYVELV